MKQTEEQRILNKEPLTSAMIYAAMIHMRLNDGDDVPNPWNGHYWHQHPSGTVEVVNDPFVELVKRYDS